MERINFGEWLPDQPAITGALTEALNVIPLQVGYGGLPTISTISNAAATDLNGLFAGRFGETTQLFASGTTKLYTYSSNNLNLTDVSSTTYTGDRWNFAQFGKIVLAANGKEKVQKFELGTSSAFATLSVEAPSAKMVTVVRDFVVCANTDANPNRVFWSDINDETSWSSSVTSQSDIQDIPDGGNIQGIVGGEFGIVFLERAISRMTYAGAPLYFQFDTISKGLGCLEPKSIAQYGQLVFFLSDDGFYLCNGQTVTPIGAEKVDRFFFEDCELALLNTMSAAVDPVRRCVFWCYSNNQSKQSLLIYNFQVQKWSRGETTADFIAAAATEAITLESLNNYSSSIDTLGISLDDRFWLANNLLLAGLKEDKIVSFSGQNSTAELITGDLTSTNSVINLAKPQIDKGTASVAIASRDRLDSEIAFSTAQEADSENRCSVRSHGRYHRVKVIPSGNYTSCVGVDLEIVARGGR